VRIRFVSQNLLRRNEYKQDHKQLHNGLDI
jgi:hypothetical protein